MLDSFSEDSDFDDNLVVEGDNGGTGDRPVTELTDEEFDLSAQVVDMTNNHAILRAAATRKHAYGSWKLLTVAELKAYYTPYYLCHPPSDWDHNERQTRELLAGTGMFNYTTPVIIHCTYITIYKFRLQNMEGLL